MRISWLQALRKSLASAAFAVLLPVTAWAQLSPVPGVPKASVPAVAATAPLCGSGSVGSVAGCTATMVLPNGATATSQAATDVTSAKIATQLSLANMLAAPPAIGSVTPNTGAFSDINLGGSGLMGGAWTVTTAGVLTCPTGTLTAATSTVRYKKFGRIVYVNVAISITTNGTCAGAVIDTMPFAAAVQATLSGRETAATGKQITGSLSAGSTSLNIQLYDSTYPGATGGLLILTGVYESAT